MEFVGPPDLSFFRLWATPIFTGLNGGCVRVKTMQNFRRVAEAEVILAFLRGEVNSKRFGDAARHAIVSEGGLELIWNPDLESEVQNRAREQALSQYRG